MAMAPPANISLHVLIVVILTAVTIATCTAGPLHFAATPSSTAEAFLRSRCSTTRNPTACYNALLPFAGSFNGSEVKLSSAATSVAFGFLRKFLLEVQHLQAAGGTGVRSGDQALGACVQDTVMGIDDVEQALSDFRLLESPGRSMEEVKNTLLGIQGHLSPVAPDECIDDFVEAGDVALGSPVAQMVVSIARICAQYGYIALELVGAITL